jgi:redox-sensitive bicupin YhaK (pirin superfamily)
VSNLELRPSELVCDSTGAAADADRPVEVLDPRLVPLGGPRAMRVSRTLPQRARSLIGPWCFIDHYGPERAAMGVPPHPHTGLQTISWLFTGQIEHRDSARHHALIRPGELNLMTAGRGISHAEESTPQTTVLHGAQLWVALPAAARFTDPAFEQYVPDPLQLAGMQARVFLGTLLGSTSPAVTHSPLVGAEITIDAARAVRVPVAAAFEHGVLVDSGTVTVAGTDLHRGFLGYLAAGRATIDLRAGDDAAARVLLVGGTPFGERIIMWWNFVGRTHDEIVEFRADWQADIGATAPAARRFGLPEGAEAAPLPAPILPSLRLKARG